jgi:sigma-E factor negative regulatory protein RseC
MEETDHITHQGLVVNCHGELAVVDLIQPAECHKCTIREFCGVSDEERNRFELPLDDLQIGDHVRLEIKPKTGFKAVFWAYFFPFLLILSCILLGNYLGIREQWVGLMALGILIPYYFVLNRFRQHLKSELDLKVKKL